MALDDLEQQPDHLGADPLERLAHGRQRGVDVRREAVVVETADGGTLLVSFFAGIVDEHDAVHPGGFGAPLRDALGVSVEELLPLRAGEQVRVAPETGPEAVQELVGEVWTDDLALEGADVVATYVNGPAAGRPAITRHRHGAGTGWYISTRLGVDALAAVLARVYRDAGIVPSGLPDELELVRRHGTEADYAIVINHSGQPVDVPLTGVDLLTGEPANGAVKVAAGAVRVVRTART